MVTSCSHCASPVLQSQYVFDGALCVHALATTFDVAEGNSRLRAELAKAPGRLFGVWCLSPLGFPGWFDTAAELLSALDSEVTETFEMQTGVRQTAVMSIKVQNQLNTFAPFQCDVTPESSSFFSVSPNEGSMNRRSGEPIEVVVRFKPEDSGQHEAYIVFETEDFKNVYKFIGST